jgi:Glycosyltransferase
MVAGLPMIVTDVGGNSETVNDHVTGLIVPPKNPQQLGEAILKLSGDRTLREKMGQAGKRRIGNQFSLDRCVEQYVAFYLGLLSDPGRPVPGQPDTGAG